MKELDWGEMFDSFGSKEFNPNDLEKKLANQWKMTR